MPAQNGLPAYCSVTVEVADETLTTVNGIPQDPGDITIDITLPDAGFNGNLIAEGGGVYAGEASPPTDQLTAGYAASTVDTGHEGDPFTSEWVVNPAGGVEWNKVNDFGYESLHQDALQSKAIIDLYYGNQPRYSFWDGCSTGGRQGMSEAQRYPTDFNGILAGAPAYAWSTFLSAEMWPQLVMQWNNDFLPSCKENLVLSALASQCPDYDGHVDGVYDPRNCDDVAILESLVGKSTACGTFTQTDADTVLAFWQGMLENTVNGSPTDNGPKDLLRGNFKWYGLEPGAALSGLDLAATEAQTLPNGTTETVGVPAPWVVDWIRNWIKYPQNQATGLSWVPSDETYQQWWPDVQYAIQQYSAALDAYSPNLDAFQAHGGKLVMWQGLSDQLIFTGDSINYYNSVLNYEAKAHNLSRSGAIGYTESFFDYFLPPAQVAHCGGPGADSIGPTNPMQVVIDWVEHGTPPSTPGVAGVSLAASGTITDSSGAGHSVTRPLCPYPDPTAAYKGAGSVYDASSYSCTTADDPTDPSMVGTTVPPVQTPEAPAAPLLLAPAALMAGAFFGIRRRRARRRTRPEST